MSGLKSFGDLSAAGKVFCLALLLLFLAGTLGAGSMKKGKDEMEAAGRVYIMGNEPFTNVAIEAEGGQVYVLLGAKEKDLRRLQGKRVSVKGRPAKEKPRGAAAIEVKSYRVLEAH